MTVRAQLHDGTVLEFPDGTADDVVARTVKGLIGGGQSAAPERSFGEEAMRKAEFASRGVLDSAAETIGAIPDRVADGMRAVGLPAPAQGFYADTLKSGINAVGRTLSGPLNALMPGVMDGPQSTGDKLVYGAGRGISDALSVIAPAAAVGKAAQAGGLAERVASSLAANPAAQTAAAMTGGGVGQATDSPLTGVLASLAVPGAPLAISKAISPVRSQLNPEQARRAAAAAAEGIDLTPGQATGSRALQVIEGAFAGIPGTGARQGAINEAQRAAFNKAVLKRAGVEADSAAPSILEDAFSAIGQRFDDLAKATTVNVDRKLFADVDGVVQKYGRRLPTDVAPVFQSYVDDLSQMRAAMPPPAPPGSVVPGGQAALGDSVQIPGDAFQNIVSGIKARARSAANNPDLQHALNRLADAVDENMIRSMGPDVATAWRDARHDYRNLLMIDKAMAGGTQADRAAGNIPYGSLQQSTKSADKSGFARGRGDVNEMSQIGDFLGASKVPTSGTSERANMINLLSGGPIFGLGAGSASLAGADPLLAIGSGVASVMLPRLVQSSYYHPLVAGYLKNQAATGLAPPPGLLGAVAMGREKDIRGLLSPR